MGKGDCECFEFDTIFKDNTANELGPAYHDYKNGKVDIERVWRPNQKLAEPFLDSCCHEEPFDFTNYYRWPDHVVLLVVWHVVSFAVLYLWWKEKDRQPLRFRPFREIIVFWLLLDFIMISTVCQLAAAFTSSCKLMLFVWDVLLPPVLVFYIVKPLQFIFIHKWNQAKKNNASLDTIKSFYDKRWMLTSRFVYLSMLAGAIPGFILFVTNLNLDTYAGYDNMYNSFRCEWWQIPKEYQVPKNPSDPRCQCIFYSQSDISQPGYADLAQNCLLGASGALPGTACYPPVDGEYTEYCNECSLMANDPTNCGPCLSTYSTNTACQQCATGNDFQCQICLATMASLPVCQTCFEVLKSKQCSNYLSHYFTHSDGACGFLAETPSTEACKFCLASNENTMAAWAAYCSFLLFVILVFLVGLVRLQDQLWLREELMAALPISVITIIIETVGLMDFDAHQQFDSTSPHYSLLYGFIFSWLWALFSVSFLMPVAVCYYYRYLATKQALEHTDDDSKSRNLASESIVDNPDKPGRKRRHGLQKLHEAQVLFAVSDQRCREIYTKFAAEEFTVENIKFLLAVHEFRLTHHTMTVAQAVEEAKDIFTMYIKQGATIEVNVPDDTKTQIGALLGEAPKRTRRRRQTQDNPDQPAESEAVSVAAAIPTSTDEVVGWFSVAFDEIVELIVRDSWGRFTASSLFGEFLTLFNSERQLDKSLGRVDQGPSVRRTDSDRKVSKMSKESKAFEVHDDL